jgi:hypothetical protein
MCYDVVRINYYCYTKTVDDNIYPAIRDLWCRDYKYDFGYEVLRYHTFWMDESSDPTKLKTNVNIEQCTKNDNLLSEGDYPVKCHQDNFR